MEGCDEMVLNSRENFLFENKLIRDTVKEYPDTTKVMKKYFGEDCLKRTGFKIKTLEIACILFGVDPNRLIEEIDKTQN
jgi:hypothetical protein